MIDHMHRAQSQLIACERMVLQWANEMVTRWSGALTGDSASSWPLSSTIAGVLWFELMSLVLRLWVSKAG
jgi:hypothetical protein